MDHQHLRWVGANLNDDSARRQRHHLSLPGNTTKITDAAGKWKKQTTDAMGNLVTVIEPNPAGGADYVTTYTYNVLGQLTSVSMPRDGHTQSRTFVYGGKNLISETNPESAERGTTSNGREKFGTYFRDADGMDYADQRYYSSAAGRFTTPDPARLAAVNIGDPASWNRYSYVQGDPINFADPSGLFRCNPEECERMYPDDPNFCDRNPDVWPCSDPNDVPSDPGPPANVGGGSIDALFAIDVTALQGYAHTFARRLRNGDLSDNCIKDIVGLHMGPDQWADALDNVSINNGIGSTVALAATLPAGSVEQQVALDRNFTVGGQFRDGSHSGTVAWSSVNDNRVWINPYLVNPGDALEDASLIAHETLHNLRLIDSVIQTRLGVPVSTVTHNISDKLGTDCFK